MCNSLLEEILRIKKEAEGKLNGYFDRIIKEAVLTLPVSAMAFYNGFVSSWNQASKFAGVGGRIAALPDIINARIATKLGRFPWKRYFTTASAEYMGFSRGGSRILIIAHGIGPMSTLKDILKAYSYERSDYKKSRERRGGRITMQEFRNLEDGKYGEVIVVDLEAVLKRYEYPFLEYLTASQALSEPLLKARFGSKAEEYIKCLSQLTQDYHRKNGNGEIADPYILRMEDASNCGYTYSIGYKVNQIDNKSAFAHLLSIGGLDGEQYIGAADKKYPNFPCLICDVGCHEWSDGVRFVGIRSNEEVKDIHPGIEYETGD